MSSLRAQAQRAGRSRQLKELLQVGAGEVDIAVLKIKTFRQTKDGKRMRKTERIRARTQTQAYFLILRTLYTHAISSQPFIIPVDLLQQLEFEASTGSERL